MKIERSSSTRGDATTTPRGLRRVVWSLFLVAAAIASVKVDAVRAVASPRANQGRSGVGNALPATTIAVTNTNDSGPGSLRNALAVANDGDTIDATGVSGTILLTSGELQITHNVTINGSGARNLAVNGNATSRVFENFASDVTIFGLTITNGVDDGNGGGGVLNHGGLTLGDSSVSNNSSFGFCGGIRTNGGTLTVTNSVISGNLARVGGVGGISATGATVVVMGSTITGDSGCGTGGIASSNGQLTVINSTISGNIAPGCSSDLAPQDIFGNGGGISFGGGTLTVSDSTISGNSAGDQGGGIWFGGGILTVRNSTISGNSAGQGGGIYNGGATQIGDTILKTGMSGGTIFNNGGTVTSLGYNLASDNGGGVLTGPGDQINTDPMLGPLQDNGGPTFTHALLFGSPAIDSGDPNFAPPPLYDQRGPGFARVVNGRIDKGSFEAQGPIPQSAFSRKTHGAAGTFDVPLPLGGNVGIECRSGGWFSEYQMIINFATNVTVQSASVTSGTGSVSSISVSGPQVTVNLTGVTDAQRITVTLFNVNDGTHTGNVAVLMGVLVGDVNGNAAVNATDVAWTKSQVGQPVRNSNFREDVDASGTITATDVAIVKSDVGTALPP